MVRRSVIGVRRNFRYRSITVHSAGRWVQLEFIGAEVTGRFPFIRRTRYAQTGFIYFIVLLSVISSLLIFLMIIFRD